MARSTHLGLSAGDYVYKYKVTGTAPCESDSAQVTITIQDAANAGADGNTEICGSSTAFLSLADFLTGEDTDGAWSVSSGSPDSNFNAAAGTLDATGLGAGTYIFQYEVTGIAPCVNDQSLVTVVVGSFGCPPVIISKQK